MFMEVSVSSIFKEKKRKDAWLRIKLGALGLHSTTNTTKVARIPRCWAREGLDLELYSPLLRVRTSP